ncbi:MAG: type VI secretion system tube protein Hcp [Nitrospinota bacterium]|nr:MAG: type VI secretion system tube protein Hcp [Nitrospinota bacterium]
MATDAFLKIDGIVGESTDDQHGGEIELLSYSHGMSQPSSIASGTGGRTAERVSMSDFSVMKVVDKASPHIAQACCDGRHIPKVTIVLCEASGEKHTFMEYLLEDVIISSVQSSGSQGGDKPLESVTFNFGKISWTYTPIGHDGKPGSKVGPIGWNLETNTKI